MCGQGLIHLVGPTRVDLKYLLSRFNQETDDSIRRAMILCLGAYYPWMLGDDSRNSLMRQLLEIYRSDPDPGIHSAVEWLLRKWNADNEIDSVIRSLTPTKLIEQRRWYVNGEGHTLAVIRNPVRSRVGRDGPTATSPSRDLLPLQPKKSPWNSSWDSVQVSNTRGNEAHSAAAQSIQSIASMPYDTAAG